MHTILVVLSVVVDVALVAFNGFIFGRMYERKHGVYKVAFEGLLKTVREFFDSTAKILGPRRSQAEIDALERIKNGRQ